MDIHSKKLNIIMLGASLDQNGGIATLEKLMLKYAPSDIQIQHLTSHDEGSIAHRVAVFGKAWLLLIWRLLTQKIDLVHIHISDGGSLLRKAILALTAFTFRKPTVMHANGAEFHVTYESLPRWAQRLLSKIFFHCDYFFPVTRLWQNYYISFLRLDEKKVFLLPNPTELPDDVPDRTNVERVTLIFCGRIGQRKGAFDLVQAFSQLPDAVKEKTRLIMAGDGAVEEGKALAEKLQVTPYVSFLGWVNSQRRDELLAKADVFLLPSYNEGLPLALMEAMGWALPVITTPVSGIPDIVTAHENGLLVPPGDVQKLSEAIHLLVEDEALRLKMGRAARETVAPLDIRPFFDHLSKIYRSILRN